MSTFKAVILTGTNQVKKNHTANIKIRITHKRKIDYIPTDLYVNIKDFDNATGLATGSVNKSHINLSILQILQEYMKKDIFLGSRKDFMTVKEIKNFILEGKTSPEEIDFFEFVESVIQSITVKNTQENYKWLISSLQNFYGHKLPVNHITPDFLNRYVAWLHSRKVKNGVVNYLRTFRALFYKCRKHYNDEARGFLLIVHNPFFDFKFPKIKNIANSHVVPIDDFRKFLNYKSDIENEMVAKDMFLLMMYLIGIESKDLFYAENPINGRLFYERFKTGKHFSIKIEPEALDIINKYPGKTKLLNMSERFLHNRSFYKFINSYLRGDRSHNIVGIFPKLNISQNVTTKWARHMWATIARNDCRISKDDVALCLGHEDADNRVTDRYILYDYSIIDESNRKVIDFILK